MSIKSITRAIIITGLAALFAAAASAQCVSEKDPMKPHAEFKQKLEQKKFDDARKQGDKAVRKAQNCFLGYLQRGAASIGTGDLAGAEADLMRAESLMNTEDASWKTTIDKELRPELNGHFARLYNVLGERSAAAKDYKQAIAYFDQAQKYLPKDPQSLVGRGRAYAWLGDVKNGMDDILAGGRYFGYQKKNAEAEAAFEEARKIWPDSAQPLLAKCSYYDVQNKWTLAFDECKEAVELEPDSSEARSQFASRAMQLERHDVAVEQYLEVFQMERKNPAYNIEYTLKYLAQSLAQTGDFEAAGVAYRKAAAVATDGEPYIALAKVMEKNHQEGFKLVTATVPDEETLKADQKIIDEAASKMDTATQQSLDALNALIKRRPNLAHAISMRGLAYQKLKQMDPAIADLTRAARLWPWAGFLSYMQAKGFIEMSKYEQCDEAASLAITIGGAGADAFDKRALCRLRLGKFMKAQEDFLRSGWSTEPNGNDVSGTALANFADANGCKVTNFDDPTVNYNNGVKYNDQKKYVCAVYSFGSALIYPKVTEKGRALSYYGRGSAYAEMREGSYAFTLQALRDFNRASSLNQLDTNFAASAHDWIARLYFELATDHIKGNWARLAYYENSIPEFEAAIRMSDSEDRLARTTNLFKARCSIAEVLVNEIRTQRLKNKAKDVDELTQKLNTVAAKIESDFATLNRDPAAAKVIAAAYAYFSDTYGQFKKGK